MNALEISADLGLAAACLATANICLGLLMAVRYSPRQRWPRRQINIFAIHNCTAYLLLATIVAHPLVLLYSQTILWRVMDIAFPVWSPVQPVENTIGAAGLYLYVLVVANYFLRLLSVS